MLNLISPHLNYRIHFKFQQLVGDGAGNGVPLVPQKQTEILNSADVPTQIRYICKSIPLLSCLLCQSGQHFLSVFYDLDTWTDYKPTIWLYVCSLNLRPSGISSRLYPSYAVLQTHHRICATFPMVFRVRLYSY